MLKLTLKIVWTLITLCFVLYALYYGFNEFLLHPARNPNAFWSQLLGWFIGITFWAWLFKRAYSSISK